MSRIGLWLPVCLLMTVVQGVAVENVIVYREAGRYGGWPANHGIWSWGDEIVVGFQAGYFKPNLERHAIDSSKPVEDVQARSLDGGRTWKVESPPELRLPRRGGAMPVASPGGIDFTHRDFALTVRMESSSVGPSHFWHSSDRCRTWKGPFLLPDFGQPGIAARTDYLVSGRNEAMLFLTAAKQNKNEGRVIVVRTADGGKTWKLVSFIGPEPAGFSIMPATVRLSGKRLLTAIRRWESQVGWIETYVSDDNGATWRFLNKPVTDTGGRGSNPPSMIKLRDGRLCLVYGYRSKPYSIRAKVSSDGGLTWGNEIMLRQDGGSWDLGYVRSVQRSDGRVVSVYYFADDPAKERFIAATIWEP